MNTSWALGFIVGLLLVAVISLVIRKLLKRKGARGEYDERQQIVRGKAYTVAYATLLIYLAVWFVLASMQIPWVVTPEFVLIGVLLSVTVFAGYSIFHDAYFKASEKPMSWIIILALVGALNLGIGVWNLVRREAGGLHASGNLSTGLALIAVLICALIKRVLDRRAEGGER